MTPATPWRRGLPVRIAPTLPWVEVARGVPYFRTDDGATWHPIGQNDSISWHDLAPLYRRKDVAHVDRHLAWLAAHGVTCLRLMLEYAQVRHRYFEQSVGVWSRNIVDFWDDLFALCSRHGLRILLTPFDTFWMWLHFRHHPYNVAHGGPLSHPSETLLSREVRQAIKARLTFAAERWGGSGALFAWDLWNEIHPAQANMSAEPFLEFIEDLSTHVRSVETRAHGRSHPQTVSLFGPELKWRAALAMEHALFRHPALDFANIHIYEQGTIDNPKNTVDPAIAMGRIVREGLDEIRDTRPFFDSEHGPIHSFKDRRITLPEHFDDEYFRHMQWAHLASGGAGGGMRWPNRHPHSLTAGMRQAQRALAGFLPAIDWLRFDRVNATDRIEIVDDANQAVGPARLARFASASQDQAVIYLLRRDTLDRRGQLDAGAAPLPLHLTVPGSKPGRFKLLPWNTVTGEPFGPPITGVGDRIALPPFSGDLALALRID